jgi:lipid II:glycine glycyltransferase (peptidoglycan interpeptide bridge formation enzyme)
MNLVSTTELAGIIRPHVGKRLRGDLTASIDILHTLGNSRRASVRSVSDDGVTVHFDGRNELIAWADIYEVTASALDERGNRLNTIVYEHLKEPAVEAAASVRRAA